jgi:hypothetical protein
MLPLHCYAGLKNDVYFTCKIFDEEVNHTYYEILRIQRDIQSQKLDCKEIARFDRKILQFECYAEQNISGEDLTFKILVLDDSATLTTLKYVYKSKDEYAEFTIKEKSLERTKSVQALLTNMRKYRHPMVILDSHLIKAQHKMFNKASEEHQYVSELDLDTCFIYKMKNQPTYQTQDA